MSEISKQPVIRVELRLDKESLEILNRKKQELNLATTSATIRTLLKQCA